MFVRFAVTRRDAGRVGGTAAGGGAVHGERDRLVGDAPALFAVSVAVSTAVPPKLPVAGRPSAT
jgi:hypothetical protein